MEILDTQADVRDENKIPSNKFLCRHSVSTAAAAASQVPFRRNRKIYIWTSQTHSKVSESNKNSQSLSKYVFDIFTRLTLKIGWERLPQCDRFCGILFDDNFYCQHVPISIRTSAKQLKMKWNFCVNQNEYQKGITKKERKLMFNLFILWFCAFVCFSLFSLFRMPLVKNSFLWLNS